LECRQCMITSKGEVLVLPFLFTPSLSLSFIFFLMVIASARELDVYNSLFDSWLGIEAFN
jgi:hypothetical protein